MVEIEREECPIYPYLLKVLEGLRKISILPESLNPP